jgi:peptidyl-prolyl isomerase D
VFGEVINGKSIVRQIENTATDSGDKPLKQVVIANCGELHGEEAENAIKRVPDVTGDPYEDYPEDSGVDLTDATALLKIAGELKELGNKAFKSDNKQLALSKYQKGLRYLQELTDPDESDNSEDILRKQATLKFTLYANSALLQNKLQRYEDALKSANSALEVKNLSDGDKAKALYRRAIAYKGRKEFEEAAKDLEEAKKLSSQGTAPKDPAIEEQLTLIKKSLGERKAKEKAAYKKFFD